MDQVSKGQLNEHHILKNPVPIYVGWTALCKYHGLEFMKVRQALGDLGQPPYCILQGRGEVSQ